MRQETDQVQDQCAEEPIRKFSMLDRLLARRDHHKHELEKLDAQVEILVKSPETRKYFELENK